MRRVTALAGLAVAAMLIWAWWTDGFEWLAYQAVQMQREFQTALAGAIRRLKAGEPGAVAGLIGLCFVYGVLHAAGPGHGKMLVGGYALANRVRVPRLLAMTLAASLTQALTAVVLVYAGVFLFDWTRQRMVDMAERSMTAASYAAIGLIGLYLGLRGLRTLWRARQASEPPPDHADHTHEGHHGHHHDHCGHSHGPSIEEIENASSLRDAVAVVAGVAIRPCTGALFLLILCWRIGANLAGIAGTFAMGLGTAVVTVAAALAAATMREGAWASGLDSLAMRRVMGLAGLAVGLVLIGTSMLMLRPYL